METLLLIAALLLGSAGGTEPTNDARHIIIDTGQPSATSSTPPTTENDARHIIIDTGAA